MIRRFVLVLGLALLAVSSGCDLTDPGAAGGDADDVIGRETFIEVYVDLQRARTASPDTVAFRARKRDILARHGVEADALQVFVDAHADDVPFLSEVWDTIEARLDAAEGDSARS